MRQSQFEDVDKAMFKWFEDVRLRNEHVSGPVISSKIQEFGTMHGIEKC